MGDFKKHLTAASDSGHRGMDEPSLTRPLWAFVSARSLGSSHSPDRHLCGLQGSPQFVFGHKVVSVTTDLIRCNGRPVRHGRHVRLLCTDGDYMPKGIYVGASRQHLTAASDSGHRGLDEPSLTRPLWASCLHDLSGSRTSGVRLCAWFLV